MDGCIPPIDYFENINNMKYKNAKVNIGIMTFIYFRLSFQAMYQ